MSLTCSKEGSKEDKVSKRATQSNDQGVVTLLVWQGLNMVWGRSSILLMVLSSDTCVRLSLSGVLMNRESRGVWKSGSIATLETLRSAPPTPCQPNRVEVLSGPKTL